MSIADVSKKIVEMAKEDQKVRSKINFSSEKLSKSDLKKLEQVDSKNLVILKKIVSKHGAVGVKKFGREASFSAWLLVQHSDTDLDFQSEYLNEMLKKPNDFIPENIAYLQDRVLVAQGKPQIYGTQFYYDKKTNKNVPYKLKYPDKVNELRAKAGLGSLEKYLK
jgi:ribosomal protein S18